MSVRKDMVKLAEFFPELVEIAEGIMAQAGGRTLEIMRVVDMMPDIFVCGPDLSGLAEREMNRNLRYHDPGLKRMTVRVAIPIAIRVAKEKHRRG